MIRILTDSASDLTATDSARPGVYTVPLSVTFADGTGGLVYLCGITVASVDQMPAYLHLGIRHFATEPAALLPLKKRLMEEDLS